MRKQSRLTGANRSRPAPLQPFRARVAEKFQLASSPVFCGSCPHYQPGAWALSDDRISDRAGEIGLASSSAAAGL